jgi:SOS response regulatory protein OraA/RecX
MGAATTPNKQKQKENMKKKQRNTMKYHGFHQEEVHKMSQEVLMTDIIRYPQNIT